MNKWLGGGEHVRNECLNICLFKEKSAELWSDQRSVTLFDWCVTLCFLVDIFDTGMLITWVLPTTRSTAALDQNIQYSEDGELSAAVLWWILWWKQSSGQTDPTPSSWHAPASSSHYLDINLHFSILDQASHSLLKTRSCSSSRDCREPLRSCFYSWNQSLIGSLLLNWLLKHNLCCLLLAQQLRK